MRLVSLTLEQFRSFSSQTIELSGEGTAVFMGPNGSGKTNILEAIAFLSTAKSCLGMEMEHLVQWGKEHFRIRATLADDEGSEVSMEIAGQVAPRRQKACFINDVRTPYAKFVGALPVVLFLPWDLTLFAGSPSRRRAFADDLLMQVSPEYAHIKMEYDRVLKQRNALLKSIAEGDARESDLDIWDERIASFGALITQQRTALLNLFTHTVSPIARSLGEAFSSFDLAYLRKGKENDLKPMQSELTDLLFHYRSRDLILRSTSAGPHREDWQLMVDGRDIATFGSRGQQRAFLLALLFAEVSYMHEKRKERPLVLLDDVFSELDDAHQQALLSRLNEYQILVTATHLPQSVSGNVSVYDVSHGSVRRRVRESAKKSEP